MATFGSFVDTTTHPTTAFNFSGVNTANEVATLFTAPEKGEIQSISCYFAGDAGDTPNAQVGVWDGPTKALLGASATFVLPTGSHSTSGQTWQTQNLVTPVYVEAGATYWLGFWRDPAKHAVWSVTASGHFFALTLQPSSAAGTFSGSTQDTTWGFTAGQIGVFATYNPVGIYADSGTTFQRLTDLQADNGAAFVTGTKVYVDDGATWRRIF